MSQKTRSFQRACTWHNLLLLVVLGEIFMRLFQRRLTELFSRNSSESCNRHS